MVLFLRHSSLSPREKLGACLLLSLLDGWLESVLHVIDTAGYVNVFVLADDALEIISRIPLLGIINRNILIF